MRKLFEYGSRSLGKARCKRFVWLILLFASHRHAFSYVGTCLTGLNPYEALINVSCSRSQCSGAGKARTCGLSVLSQALYH